jgi:hypothetical protein
LSGDATWLARFGDKDWRHHLQRAARDHKFSATLKPRLDRAIEDWHESQPPSIPPPIISADELRITAPWAIDEQPGADQTRGPV